MSKLHEELNKPFSYEEYGVNYEGQVYVGVQSIVDRLNSVVGVFNWQHDILEKQVDMENFTTNILGQLKIYDEEHNRWISRTQFGNDTMKIHKGESTPRGQTIVDSMKAAVSDSLKKAAAWFGAASDVFKGRVIAIPPANTNGEPNKLYSALLEKYNLNGYLYRNGIPILPDDYREYYENKGWFGIFMSDLKNAFHPSQQPSDTNIEKTSHKTQSPQQYRVKVLTEPRENPDGSSYFRVLMETSEEKNVFVPKELTPSVMLVVSKDLVLNVMGWLKGKTLRLDKNSKIQIERKAS